jgi:hypothetical protein
MMIKTATMVGLTLVFMIVFSLLLKAEQYVAVGIVTVVYVMVNVFIGQVLEGKDKYRIDDNGVKQWQE